MILVAGLTPAWQQILRFDRLRWGQVNRASEAHWCPSGKVLNVGIALAQLEADAETLAPLGGPAGDLIAAKFAALGAAGRWIDVNTPTRVCTTLLEKAGATTELVENAGPLTDAELAQYRTIYAARAALSALVVLTGSLPQAAPQDFFARLLAATQCPAILDLRGPELLETLVHRPLVVKPNREELGQTLNCRLDGDDELRAAMEDLRVRGAQWVVVSQGELPIWACGPAQCYRVSPARVTAVNPIGSGDCLAAGLAWKLAGGHSMLESLRWAVAAASLNAASLLPARFDASAVGALAATLEFERC